MPMAVSWRLNIVSTRKIEPLNGLSKELALGIAGFGTSSLREIADLEVIHYLVSSGLAL